MTDEEAFLRDFFNEQDVPHDASSTRPWPLCPVDDVPLGQRWYCVSRDGLATLCLNEANAREMAVQCAADYPRQAPYRAVQLGDVAAERERCAKLAETSHPHDWAFIGAAIRAEPKA